MTEACKTVLADFTLCKYFTLDLFHLCSQLVFKVLEDFFWIGLRGSLHNVALKLILLFLDVCSSEISFLQTCLYRTHTSSPRTFCIFTLCETSRNRSEYSIACSLRPNGLAGNSQLCIHIRTVFRTLVMNFGSVWQRRKISGASRYYFSRGRKGNRSIAIFVYACLSVVRSHISTAAQQ